MRRLFSLLICVVATTFAFAQETNCTNGLDDDGDGFIDCYDSDCALNTACDDIFIGNDATCTLEPPPAPAFTMTLDFASENETTNHFSRMVIGDLDRDGIPEIVTMNKYTNNLVILNGNGGAIKFQAIMANGATPQWEIAIANLNDDNCAEIFFLATDSRIYVYDCQLNFLYNTPQMPGGHDPINFGIADFGGDGRSEIYCKDEIFNAHTGARLRATTLSAADWGSKLNGGPVAVDMNNDGDLELVVGLTIYDVNVAATTLTVLATRPEYFVRNDYNATSVADYNQDGFMDVIASGSAGCHSNNTTIFFWDVQLNTLRTYSDQDGTNGSDYEDGWQNGTGRVNIADLDGDGQLNLSYVSGKYLYALKEDMTRLWRKVVKEETSGYTGCTLFDFNGDGKSEVVYRDEQSIYIIDGVDGTTFNSQPCISRTNREYPIVADVDADGSTEICVTCGFDDALAQANFTTTSYSRYSHVRVFESAAEPWVPARRVWNQHGYFVVNVNDDLTIPIQQQLHSKQFSTTACRPGDPVGPVRPLNKFLNQSPFIDTNGCPAYLAPDLDYATAVTFIPPLCPGLDFQVQFTITNRGEVPISGDIPVTFYDSNPLRPGANPITTLIFTISDLDTNQPFIVNETITSNGSDSLFVVLNDAGTTVPTPISLPNTPYLECNYDNVRGIAISPIPVAITALEVTPNELCAVPPTGSVRAFVPMGGGIENTADYDFYWFDGPTVGPVLDSADSDGPIYTSVLDGTYSVFAIHKTANCSSDTALVVVNPAPGILPTVNVTLISNQTNCDPPNGSLQASVAGGNSGYTFEWEDIAAPIGVSGPLLANQNSGTYTVIVSHTASGCQTSADGTIGDLTQEPDVVASATPVSSCTNLLSGTVTAEAFKGLTPQPDANYVFDWYFYDNVTGTRGSLIPPIHGALGTPDRTGLPIGFYEVTITEISSGCTGNPSGIVQVADQRVVVDVVISELAPQTSCNPLTPNGRMQAAVTIGGVPQPASNFTFEWFVGQNTLPANAHTTVSGTNGSIAENVRGGGQSYTVRATNANQCSGTDDGVITQTLNLPVVTLTPTPNGICDPVLASGNFTGTLTASVTFAGSPVVFPNANYSFTWYNGDQAVGAPRTENTNALTQLDSGYYTVVVNRTDLGCAAAPETEFVDNTTVLPVILTETDSSTNCTPPMVGVTPNGRGVVSRVDGVNPNPATHTFLWHDGINTTTPIVGSTNPILGSLQGGVGEFYTVLVTNSSNGCQNTATVEIPDAQEKPVITLLPSDNSICDPPPAGVSNTGSVLIQTITYKGAPFVGALTHQWFNGVGTGTPNASSTTATLPNLDAGFYSAQVTLTATGCTADFVSAEVEDVTILPTILITPTPSTNCAGGTANGQLSATVDPPGPAVPTTTGFSFQWYTGITITDPIVPNSPNNGNTALAIQLQGGQDFTVEATNLSTGCKNTETLILQDDSEIPVITPLLFSPNLNCTAPFNGTASVAATAFTYRGNTIAAPYTGFNLVWSGGTVNAGGDGITALPAGPYTLQVTAAAGNSITTNNDNCISSLAPVTILDDLTYPLIDITETNQTSCDITAPNGQLAAIETSGTGTYSFDWFLGAVVGAPGSELAEISDGLTTAVLVGGSPGTDYTVRVTNTSTRCEAIQTTVLTDNITLPTLALVATSPVTNCANPDGQITATPTVTSTADGDFTIFYLKQNTTDPLLVKAGFSSTDNADFVRPNLGPGFFASLIRDEITHCESQVVTAQVVDQTDPADITLQSITNASFCGVATGGIDVTVSGIAPAFTFAWHVGGPTNMGPYDYINDEDGTTTPTFNPDVPPFPVTTEDLTAVTNGLYTLEVIDARGCGAIFTESIPFVDAPTIIVTQTNSTQCDLTNGDGSITTDVNGINNYTIRLYLGLDLATATLIDTDGPFALTANVTTTSLDPGDYLIEITDNIIGCPVYRTATIGVDARDPVVTLGTIIGNTSCVPGTAADGSVEITIAKDPLDLRNPATIQYQITAIAPVPLGGVPPAYGVGATPVTDVLTGFAPVQYQITVTELSSGCDIVRFVTVPDQPVMPVLGQTDITVINDSFCAPNSNGSAQVTTINPVAIVDYEFSWYSSLALPPVYVDNGGGGNGELFNSTKPGYTLGAAGQGTGNQTFFVRGERLPGTGVGVGCPTPAVQIVIQDEHVTPVLTLTSTPDTSCDPLIGEGSISVATVTNSPAPAVQNALYTYSISPDPNAIGSLPNSNGAVSTPYIELTDATYTVTALNQISGCPVSGTSTVIPGLFNFIVTNAIKNDKLICLLDGDITVTEITIDRSFRSLPNLVFNTPLNTDFEFRWFKNAPAPFISASALADNTAVTIDTENFVIGNGGGQFDDPAPTLGAGSYYVVARQLSGPGRLGANCESVPLRVEILDTSEDPVAALAPTTDTSCNGPFEGSISVLVSDNSPVPGPFTYNYIWSALTVGRTPPGPITNPYNGTNNLFTLVEDGLYELTALNNQTGCTSIATQTTVSKTAIPIVVASATHTDQLICNPDGSITVVDITVNSVIDGNHNNFYFLWYKDVVTAGTELVPFNPPAGNDILDITDLPTTIGEGTYFVKAQRVLGLPLGSGCESAPFRVDILDQSVDPDLNFTSVKPDSSCVVLNPLGMIEATASERDGTTDAYTFTWTFNGAPIASPPPTSPTSQLNNAAAGNYVVTVTNTPTTGCSFTRGVTLALDTTRSLPNIVTVNVIDPINCTGSGTATVVEITVGGTTTFTNPPDDIDTDFDYEWRASGSPAIISTASNINSLAHGFYFVNVREVNTGCSSSFVEVFVDSADIVYPIVTIQQTAPQASCNVALGTGVLASTADGQTDANPNYTFTWFPTPDLTGTSFANTSTVTGLFSGGYSVRAHNALTNCSASALFIVPVDSLEFLPQLILTSGPLTECDSIDGSVYARGLHFPVTANPADNYPFAYSYTADLYVGSPPANLAVPEHPNMPNDPNNPTFTESFLQPNLVNGLYTVRLTDNNTGCITIDTISVEDARVFPNPTITEISPVTNCDPLRPNGVARALVNGSFNGHSFQWFEGATATGTVLYTGAQFDELHPTPVQYTVLATHLVTGCTGDVTATISNGQVAVPSPDVVIVSNVTSCVVNNGALSASVGGNTINYIFNWFDPPPNFVGAFYDSLAVGTYSVTATSRMTGCVSPPTSEDIIAEPVFPGLDFQIVPASCGQNNGSASLSIISSVAISSVTWFDVNGAVVTVGPSLDEVYAGTYSVNVVTILGCESEEIIEIDTEIRPRNFISRNGDNSNSYFHIDCIENFTIENGAPQDNRVKIFNRVGTLVYEMDGYDNVDIYFNGKSNKGIGTNLMGTELPDGTYFFIVDKKDGSRPMEGYLEIVK